MSARATILAAIASVLSTLVSGRVYRSRLEQLPDVPAIVIEPISEDASEQVLGQLDRRLQVAVRIFARGDIPDDAADPVLSAAWAALSAPASLGAEVQVEVAHSVLWETDDVDTVRATLGIAVGYRTAINAM